MRELPRGPRDGSVTWALFLDGDRVSDKVHFSTEYAEQEAAALVAA